MKNIAIVVPTIRPETLDTFLSSWKELFEKHNVELVVVNDSQDKPFIETKYLSDWKPTSKYGWYSESNLISNKCAGVRQLGFKFIAECLPDIEYIFTTDDDCTPIGDPIQDHIDALNKRVPISWTSTATNFYPRGMPYGVREEAPAMLSHGVWECVPDYDAPTQLLMPKDFKPEYFKGVIPKGIFFPMCGMNICFKREALPYVFFAPVGQYKGAERFDDIFAGLEVVKDFAKLNWGIVSGFARVKHERASNVFKSLVKEAVGIAKNEEYWRGIYDDWYKGFVKKRKSWNNLVKKYVSRI